MTDPFKAVKAINQGQDVMRGDDPPDYNAWMVQRAFSYYIDTILFANEININNPDDNLMHFDYLLNSVTPKRRIPKKWPKAEKTDSQEIIMDHYKVSLKRAREIERILSPQQIEQLKIIKGGKL